MNTNLRIKWTNFDGKRQVWQWNKMHKALQGVCLLLLVLVMYATALQVAFAFMILTR